MMYLYQFCVNFESTDNDQRYRPDSNLLGTAASSPHSVPENTPIWLAMRGIAVLLVVLLCETILCKMMPRLPPRKSPSRPVKMPRISKSHMEDAFTRAHKQAEARMAMENGLAKKGGTYSKTVPTPEARFLGAPNPRSLEMHRIQIYLEDVTKNLNHRFRLNQHQMSNGLRRLWTPENDSMLQQCRGLYSHEPCDPKEKYRRADASCSNLKHPNWGRSFTCYDRLLFPAYADGLSSPRMSHKMTPLPNARLASTKMGKDFPPSAVFYTHMAMQWGQFLDHDIAQAVSPRAGDDLDIYKCCPITAENPEVCYAFSLPQNDPFFGKLKKDCMNFVRSIACSADCSIGSPRRQINQQTSYVDGSSIYGENTEQMTDLRTLKGGLLKVQKSSAGDLLPGNFKPELDQCTSLMGNVTCFQAGDSRVNSQPGLTALHTLWVRHHNLVASILSSSYPAKSDEEIFQEARRIVGAQYQVVTYKEFLPDVLGPDYINYFQLKPLENGNTKFQPDVNPSLVTEFASGAFRFGHTMIQNTFAQVNAKGELVDPVVIQDNMFRPISMYEGKLGAMLKGMSRQPSQGFDKHFVDSMKNHLFQVAGSQSGLDLTSINVQRGRDHGVPGYAAIIEYCFGKLVQKFADLDAFMLRAKRKQLETIYSSVHDVDFYFGGLSETPMEGAIIGPTFGCITGLQFSRLKYGDRFFYEHSGQSVSFTPGQLAEIRKTSLAKIICDNAEEIGSISRDVFKPPGPKNPVMKCEEIPGEDLKKWFDI